MTHKAECLLPWRWANRSPAALNCLCDLQGTQWDSKINSSALFIVVYTTADPFFIEEDDFNLRLVYSYNFWTAFFFLRCWRCFSEAESCIHEAKYMQAADKYSNDMQSHTQHEESEIWVRAFTLCSLRLAVIKAFCKTSEQYFCAERSCQNTDYNSICFGFTGGQI